MPSSKLLILIAVFFFTSLVSVVTGSTSLITVPTMIALGIETHVAIATNMLALTFMSVGGSLSFAGKGVIHRKRLPLSLVVAALGSMTGALILVRVPVVALQITVAVAMMAAVVFSLIRRDFGFSGQGRNVSPASAAGGYVVAFLLAIYGGFFGGGYVTMLTAAFILLFGMKFLESVATTKVVNIVSSGVATLVFLRNGIADVKLGILLGMVMFVGALLGGRISMKLSPVWLQRIFITAVLGLALRMLWFAAAH